MKITANIEVSLKPFMVPNYVIEQTPGEEEGRSIKLSELDPITLAQLCREFTTEVFKRAGKSQPPGCA